MTKLNIPAKLYKLDIHIEIESEYDNTWCEVFLTEEEMNTRKAKLVAENTREDGSYVPNITYMEITPSETTFEEVKCEMTISQFEQLFGVNIKDCFE